MVYAEDRKVHLVHSGTFGEDRPNSLYKFGVKDKILKGRRSLLHTQKVWKMWHFSRFIAANWQKPHCTALISRKPHVVKSTK